MVLFALLLRLRAVLLGWGPSKSDLLWRPIGESSVQLASKTDHFLGYFQRLGRVRAIESSRLMERAMGIEPTSETWEKSRHRCVLTPF
jgi:hypothetical protein